MSLTTKHPKINSITFSFSSVGTKIKIKSQYHLNINKPETLRRSHIVEWWLKGKQHIYRIPIHYHPNRIPIHYHPNGTNNHHYTQNPYNLIFVVMNQMKYNLNIKIPKIAFWTIHPITKGLESRETQIHISCFVSKYHMHTKSFKHVDLCTFTNWSLRNSNLNWKCFNLLELSSRW